MYIKSDESIKKIISATFPDYKGNKFEFEETKSLLFVNTSWSSGGSRVSYAVYHLETGDVRHIPHENPMVNNPIFTTEFNIPENSVVVAYHQVYKYNRIVFHGTGITNPRLEEKKVLTKNQEIVLVYTRSLKSSYAGISNYRFHEAHNDMNITQADWDAAVLECQQNGWMDKRKALTVDGKNMAGNKQTHQLKYGN